MTRKDVFDLETATQAPGGAEHSVADEVVLVLVRGPEGTVVAVLEPDGELVFGRGRGAGVFVDDVNASREHCVLRSGPRGVELVDLASRNGTWLRGKRIEPNIAHAVAPGDTATIGGYTIVVATQPRPSATPKALDDDEALELGETVVADPASLRVYRAAQRIALTTATVMIHGETGAGKEVLAEQIHRWSPRHSRPFLRVNCAALPETLLESELFGHERGAFTGADKRRAGLFESAEGGTILLDELGELSLATQAKLLRVLEARTIQPLGSSKEIAVDVRVICATHRDLEAMVKKGQFREDLYYRVVTFVLSLPPLRERPNELALLAQRFLERFAAREKRPGMRLTSEATQCLLAYRWPGNVRELRNAIEHAVVLCDGEAVQKQHLPRQLAASPSRAGGERGALGVKEELDAMEKQRIQAALEEHAGNRTRAAQALGMSRRALIHKLHKYELG